jgi:hypothetical protein
VPCGDDAARAGSTAYVHQTRGLLHVLHEEIAVTVGVRSEEHGVGGRRRVGGVNEEVVVE